MEIRSIIPFLDYWERIRGRTVRVAERIPPDHLETSDRDGAFTLGDLLRHMGALERYMFAETVARRPSRYPGHGRELADGYEEVFAYLDRMHRESMEIFASLSDADLQERCVTPAGAEIRVWKWLRAMVEHHVHHRGQIYLLLGQLGIATPPLWGLTSEDVRERSVEIDPRA